MKKLLIVLSLLLFVSVAQPAKAQDIDMSTYTCKDLIEDQGAIPFMIFWIDGYMSAMSESYVIGVDWMESLTEQIVTYCHRNPSNTVMAAMDAVE